MDLENLIEMSSGYTRYELPCRPRAAANSRQPRDGCFDTLRPPKKLYSRTNRTLIPHSTGWIFPCLAKERCRSDFHFGRYEVHTANRVDVEIAGTTRPVPPRRCPVSFEWPILPVWCAPQRKAAGAVTLPTVSL